MLTGVTSHSEKTMGEDATLQIVVKFALHIGGQAFGARIGCKVGQKGLEMGGDDLVEDPATGVSRLGNRNFKRPCGASPHAREQATTIVVGSDMRGVAPRGEQNTSGTIFLHKHIVNRNFQTWQHRCRVCVS